VLAALALLLLFAAISSVAAAIVLAAAFALVAALRTLCALFNPLGRALAILRRQWGRRGWFFNRLFGNSGYVLGGWPG